MGRALILQMDPTEPGAVRLQVRLRSVCAAVLINFIIMQTTALEVNVLSLHEMFPLCGEPQARSLNDASLGRRDQQQDAQCPTPLGHPHKFQLGGVP